MPVLRHRKVDPDPHGAALAANPDPLGAATKLMQKLKQHAAKRCACALATPRILCPNALLT